MDVMKDISEIEGYEDVVTWCRDFFSATDSIHADIGVSPLLYRSERNLLMSLVSYLFDYLPSEDLTTDALLTLLSMAETKPDDYLGHEQVCPIDRIGETHLYGFDATEPGSFDRAIECHQLHSTRGMPGNDRITLGGEAQAMKAASAEMADGTEKHDIGLDAR